MKGDASNSWDWLVRVEERDLLLDKRVVNGESKVEDEAFVNGNVEKPVVIG